VRDAVTPRMLVQVTLYEPDSDEVRTVAFDAVQPRGSIGDGKGYEKEIIGFAEFTPYTNVGRYRDAEAFVSAIETRAQYVYWKPEADLSQTGVPAITGGGDGA
jgi:hypothetical protein